MTVLEKMGNFFSTQQAKWAFFFTFGLFFIVISFGTLGYETNDDIMITALLKGLFGLAASSDGVFVSPLLGGFLFLLYKLLPAVPWFSLFLYFGVVLACFLAALTILMTIRTVGGKIAGLSGVALFISLVALQINSGAVSLLLWVTGCAFLLQAVRHKKTQNLWVWLASLQIAYAYLLRPSLLPLLILLATPMFTSLVQSGGKRFILCVLGPFIVVFISSVLVSFVLKKDINFDYQEFNSIRSEFNDTSRSLPGDKTTKALFAAGWSKEDYVVSLNWWLHDASYFNSRQIKTFLESNSSKSSIFVVDTWKKNLTDNIIHLKLIFIWLLVLLCTLSFDEIKNINYLEVIIYIFLIFGVFVLMGIRFPQRVSYPCFFMLFLYLAQIFNIPSKNKRTAFFRIVPPIIFIVYSLYLFLPLANQKVNGIKQNVSIKNHFELSLVNILKANGTDSIIVDVNPQLFPVIYFPFRENGEFLSTRIMPGGWLVGAPAYLDFLHREGLGDRSTAVPSMIDNRRIVFRFWDTKILPFEEYKEIFLKYLQRRYGAVAGNNRFIDLKILQDYRQGTRGLVYFQLESHRL